MEAGKKSGMNLVEIKKEEHNENIGWYSFFSPLIVNFDRKTFFFFSFLKPTYGIWTWQHIFEKYFLAFQVGFVKKMQIAKDIKTQKKENVESAEPCRPIGVLIGTVAFLNSEHQNKMQTPFFFFSFTAWSTSKLS